MIEIPEFKLRTPDSDGDMRYEINFQVTNTTADTIRQLRHKSVFLGSDGGPVSSDTRNIKAVRLDPGDATSFNYSGWIKNFATGGDRDDVKVISSVRLMTREFIKLGSVDVPPPGCSISKTMSLESDVIDGDAIVNVFVGNPDSNGDCCIVIRVFTKNATNHYIEEAEVTAELFDEEDANIGGSFGSDNIPFNSIGIFEMSFWGMNKSKFRDTRVEIDLYLWLDVASAVAERISEPADD